MARIAPPPSPFVLLHPSLVVPLLLALVLLLHAHQPALGPMRKLCMHLLLKCVAYLVCTNSVEARRRGEPLRSARPNARAPLRRADSAALPAAGGAAHEAVRHAYGVRVRQQQRVARQLHPRPAGRVQEPLPVGPMAGRHLAEVTRPPEDGLRQRRCKQGLSHLRLDCALLVVWPNRQQCAVAGGHHNGGRPADCALVRPMPGLQGSGATRAPRHDARGPRA